MIRDLCLRLFASCFFFASISVSTLYHNDHTLLYATPAEWDGDRWSAGGMPPTVDDAS